jgi:GT2 family glycosyltransferase
MSVISVIIVNWNGKHLLSECLDTLRAQTRPADEILVVDNGSSDGSQAMVRECYPDVTLIELRDNKGFSVANNIGIRRARGDYVALLNNDLALDQGWISLMAAALDADPSLGSCACKMLCYDRRGIIDSAGINVRSNGAGRNRGLCERDAEPYDRPARVFGACAGAAMYRASMFRDIGVFDEDFHIYFEDIDLAFRAQLAGYECLYVPQAVAYHHGSASGSRLGKKYFYVARNSLLVILKNMPAPLLWPNLPHIVAVPLSYAVYSGMTGQVGEYVRICWSTMRLLPRMLHKRRLIHLAARRTPDEIRARLT